MKKYTFEELYKDKFNKIPCCSGVYFVYIDKNFKQEFVNPGTGGFFDCDDPNVSKEELSKKWVDGAEILYIGQTKGRLKERIALFCAFGKGYPVAHWGGRYIWQIKDAINKLYVYWEECDNPREKEKKLLRNFEDKYGKLPFANLIN